MSLTYSTYVTTLANLLVVPEDDDPFVEILPSIIDYAEGRIYRDLDLLANVVVDSSSSVNANTRNATLPIPSQGTYQIIDQINLIESSSRTPLTPVSREVLDLLWPSSTAASASTRPVLFAMTSNTVVSFGPPSGATVTLEYLGRVKPTALSASNTSTYLTNQIPELFVAASMVFASGWQKNFGNTADDPGSAMSWESQYNKLLADSDQDAARAKFAGASWTSKRPEPYATPQRG